MRSVLAVATVACVVFSIGDAFSNQAHMFEAD
jgi:hypothetical protein